VAFLLVVVGPLLRRCPLRARWLLVGATLALFVLVTRAEPSVLRAAAMAAVASWASLSGRAAAAARVLGLAVVALLVVDPMLVHSTGFRLSVAATVGLLVLAGPIADRLPGPAWLTAPLSVTLAAQLATAPVLLTFTDGIPPAATAANLLAVGPAGLVMALGIAVGLPAGWLRPELAAVVQLPARVLVWWVDGVARWASRLPLVPLDGVRLAVAVGLVGSAVALWRRARRHPRRSRVAVRLVVVVAAACAWAVLVVAPRPEPGVHLVGPSARVVVDHCGGVAVEVAGGPVDDVLAALQAAGVTAAASVDGADRWTVAAVAEQLGAAVGAATGSDGVPCSVPP
jgi:competence protein ComEC